MEDHPADSSAHAGSLGNIVLAVTRESSAIHDTAGAWVAVKIALSAILYLFDFGTNLSTLHQYYTYAFNCHNHMQDPICLNMDYYSVRFRIIFGVTLFLMTVAHLSNSLIFWMTLSPNEHPLRLAYFLPLIHLSRLLKVLWLSTSSGNRSLKDLQHSREQSSTLYNVLGASLETIPLLILQFRVTITLGEYGGFFLDSDLITQPNIPKIMIISLLASVVSGTYNGSVAVLSLVPKHNMSLARKACIAILAGFHTLAAMSAKAVIIAALADSSITFFPTASDHQFSYHLYIVPVFAYIFIGVITPWIFFSYLLRMPNNRHSMKRWMRGAHSLALTHVSFFIGPMYVIVKYFKRLPYFYTFLILGTLLHIFVELVGLGVVLIPPKYLPFWHNLDWDVPCHHNSMAGNNIFFTCSFFLGTFGASLLLLILIAMLFVLMEKRHSSLRVDEHQEATNALDQLPNSGVVHIQLVSHEHEKKQKCALMPIRQQGVVSSTKLLLLIFRAFLFKVLHKRASFHMLD